jgi:tripartite-type tricarboxylate transporter receptor subunit TctC
MRFKRCISSVLAVLACPAAAAVSYAAAYPERPITIIIPYPPGGATHIVTASVAREMEKQFGQPVRLEHKAGRDGMIALEAAGKAAPDGYTLMAGNPTTNAVNPVVRRRQLPFDYAQAIAPVTVMSEIPNLFLVAAAFPAASFAEFIAYVKQNPGKVKFGAPGIGAGEHLNGLVFGKAAGLDMPFQPHAGGALEALRDLVDGKFQWAMVNAASSAALIKQGKIKPLAVSGSRRVPAYPDVPTVEEAGYKGIFSNAWQALFAPGGTPQEIIDKLHRAVVAAVGSPAVREEFEKRSIIAVTSRSPEAFAAELKADIAQKEKIVAETGIVIE